MAVTDAVNADVYNEICANWDKIAKPLNGLGQFEEMIARIGSVQGTTDVDISRRCVIIMCADNGVVEEGVTQSGQEVTSEVASWMGRGESSVCKMASVCKCDTIPVDIGINSDSAPEGLLDFKVRKGTRNFLREPAMTQDECLAAIRAGIRVAEECRNIGYKLVATGEMGIGNTTTSSALAAAMLGLEPEAVTGRGAGLSDEGFSIKLEVVRKALKMYNTPETSSLKEPARTLWLLRTMGGLDIAGMAGVYIGCARFNMPVIIDGFISAIAALAAERMYPGCRKNMIASHLGKEAGMKYVMKALGLTPVIAGDLALGEGTGAVMLMPLLDMALALYSTGLEFSDTGVEQYVHFDEEMRML